MSRCCVKSESVLWSKYCLNYFQRKYIKKIAWSSLEVFKNAFLVLFLKNPIEPRNSPVCNSCFFLHLYLPHFLAAFFYIVNKEGEQTEGSYEKSQLLFCFVWGFLSLQCDCFSDMKIAQRRGVGKLSDGKGLWETEMLIINDRKYLPICGSGRALCWGQVCWGGGGGEVLGL